MIPRFKNSILSIVNKANLRNLRFVGECDIVGAKKFENIETGRAVKRVVNEQQDATELVELRIAVNVSQVYFAEEGYQNKHEVSKYDL